MTAGRGSRVTVFAKSTAVSTSPVRPGKTYPLSVLDHAMAGHSLHHVFYYRPGPAMDRNRLKESLSDVLSHYPAVTGRLTREAEGGGGDWVVKCNDAGVRVLDARASATLDGWLSSASAAEETELAYWEPMGKDPSIWSPFYIQITEFEDRGYAIGLSCTHMQADPTCAVLLVKAWGDAHRGAFIANPPFFHPPGLCPRPSPNTATASAALLALKSEPSAAPAARMSSASFRFSDQAVRACLAEIGHACPDATPFDALASLFWCSIARAGEAVGPSALTLCVDFRKLLHAPLPHGFHGNALHFSRVRADLAEGWGHVARELRGHAAAMEEEEYWSAIDWFESRREPGGSLPAAFPLYGPELTCARLDQAFAYGAAFERGELGRPVHVTCRVGGVEGEGLVLVLPSPEEGAARTVSVTLPEEVTARICQDDAILRHGPTLLLCE